jgi:hypothetical protein
MRVIATTVVRESIRGKQRSGFIYDVDWDAQEVQRRLPVPEPSFPQSDDNPRGGVRGGRGVAVTKHGIVVANYDTLHIYDDDWKLLDDFSHPLFVGTHEIDWDGEHIWTAATGIDAVLKVSLDGSATVAWDPHEPDAARLLGVRRRPHPVDGSVDYRIREAPLIDQCHINGVTRHNGSTVVNCGLIRPTRPWRSRMWRRASTRAKAALRLPEREKAGPRHAGRSMVVRADEGEAVEVLVELGGHDFPTHNGQLLDDRRVAVNDSSNNSVRVFSIGDRRELTNVRIPGTWLRGMEPVDGSRLLVGTAPATIMLLDVESGEVEGRLQLSENPNEAIHGLVLCPPVAERT